jgi:hypothetical protein
LLRNKILFYPEGNTGGNDDKDKKTDIEKENAELKKQLLDLKDKLGQNDTKDKFFKKDDKDGEDDKSLDDKAKDDKDAKDRLQASYKEMEAALSFTMSKDSFLKENKNILPSEIENIFLIAEKEKYDNAMEKANAIKSAVIKSFFSIQGNVDMLTTSQKNKVEDYLKLTKTAREEKAHELFENVFQPTVEMIKRVNRAAQVAKANAGLEEGSDVEKAYKNKLIENSTKFYLGGK